MEPMGKSQYEFGVKQLTEMALKYKVNMMTMSLILTDMYELKEFYEWVSADEFLHRWRETQELWVETQINERKRKEKAIQDSIDLLGSKELDKKPQTRWQWQCAWCKEQGLSMQMWDVWDQARKAYEAEHPTDSKG